MPSVDVESLNSRFYVYIIFRPNGIPCYVGKGKGKRYLHHSRFSSNRYLKNIYAQNGGHLSILKIRDNLLEEEAFSLEIHLISKIGRCDIGKGPLVNNTDGGDGTSGHIVTEETRNKLRKKRPPRSLEWSLKISDSLKGRERSPESCLKQSITMTGRKNPLATLMFKGKKRPDVSARLLGSKSPDHRKLSIHWIRCGSRPDSFDSGKLCRTHQHGDDLLCSRVGGWSLRP